MAVEKADAAMIVNRLRVARELEDDCLKQLFVSYGASTFDLGIARNWKSLVKNSEPTERMPFRFITPLTEEEENF